MEKLIELPEKGKVVFLGDTHGDYNTTRMIIKGFINKDNHYIVMLGDYVDRGKDSRKNIDFLLDTKKKHPNLIMLAGNHEMFFVRECSPSDFWDSLSKEDYEYYKNIFSELPLVISGNGFLGLHGALPDIEKIEDIDTIQPGDENWIRIIWGDFRDKPGMALGNFLGRPKFGRDYFLKVMERLEKNVLIRGHDPLVSERIFNNRCLTLFTSSNYGDRKIAILDLEKEVKSIDDIEIVSLDAVDIKLC
ncbi:MAG: serine/threonine protein phosphatase [Candidatus Omnitrophica bacterium]|nr:serine/threonine protein phosphatase [Candidatus Omnitrophota bacterium]MCM8776644.1 serine/threonine protein phosphatase [Candidatus Omnitrophota bacterium]